MIQAPDPLKLGKNRENLKLSYVKEGFNEGSKPIWKLGDIPTSTSRLIRDLNLSDLGKICSGETFENAFAYILANPLTEEKDIEDQRNAIQEISAKDQEFPLERIIDSMYELGAFKEVVINKEYFGVREAINKKLTFLGDYHRLLTNLESRFENSESEALQSISDHVKNIRNSDEASFVPMVVDRGKKHLRLNLEITEDDYGQAQLRFTKSKYGRRIPGLTILKHLGHRIKAKILFMFPYRRKVNSALTELINHNMDVIDQTLSLIPDLEFYKGAAIYEKMHNEQKQESSLPRFSQNGTLIRDLKHPMFTVQGKEVIPNDYESTESQRVLLITGANNGGKTFYSKLIGMSYLLAQRGFEIPSPDAEMSIVDAVYTHFVDQDDPIHGQGRYKFELTRMNDILESCTSRSLIIVDEPCGGTDPSKGEVQSSYFLEALSQTGAKIIFNTHYHNLANMQNSIDSIRNVHPDTRFNDGKLEYLRKMLEGPAGTSYALEVAQAMDLGRESLLRKGKEAKKR